MQPKRSGEAKGKTEWIEKVCKKCACEQLFKIYFKLFWG